MGPMERSKMSEGRREKRSEGRKRMRGRELMKSLRVRFWSVEWKKEIMEN